MNQKKIDPIGVLLVLGCILLAVGTKTYFGACEPTETEVMSCHYAEQAVFGLSIVLLIQGVSALFMGLDAPNIRKGLCIAMIPTALLAVIIPGYLIPLCDDASMACHTDMNASVKMISFGIAVFASLYASQFTFTPTRSGGKENKPKAGKKKSKK